jgi:hypothetical protein
MALVQFGTETNKDERNTPEYLAQLLKDKKQIQAFPNVFVHLEKLLDEGKFDIFCFSRSHFLNEVRLLSRIRGVIYVQ